MKADNIIGRLVKGPAQLSYGNVDLIEEIMPVMRASFSDAYGESWNERQCYSMLALPGTRLLVARIDDTVCGFAISRIVLDEEELLMIAVNPKHQHQDIGSQLMSQIICRTREDAGNSIFLEVRSNNQAQKLYKEFGFEEIGKRTGYYTGANKVKYDAITYQKQIRDHK